MKTWMFYLFIIIAAAEALTSCRARQAVVSERTIYDTVWTEKTHQSQRNDSVTVREVLRIVPHIIRVGDTTIIHSDTTIIQTVERNHYDTRNIYQNEGRIRVDTAYIERTHTVAQPTNNSSADRRKAVRNRLKMAALTAILAMVISLLIRYRKQIVMFIRRLAKRTS